MKKIIIFLFFFTLPYCVYALSFPNQCESKYFTIYYQQGVDSLDVAYKINIGGSVYLYKDKSKTIIAGGEPKEILIQNMDALFNEVSDILDMHLYSYHGDIKIYHSREELKKKFFELFNRDLKSKAFYYHDKNVIYISAEGLRPAMLAHEMAHAIISHYFVVLPPMKVQEVLAGYVEYMINKKISKKGISSEK